MQILIENGMRQDGILRIVDSKDQLERYGSVNTLKLVPGRVMSAQDKQRSAIRDGLHFVLSCLCNIGLSLRLLWSQHRVLVSLGPSFAVWPAIIIRMKGGTVVHLESWSRFEQRSTAGKMMYRVANYFLVQNDSLLSVYPKAVYAGRL